MDYFKDVYLKRLNRDGNNIQERIKSREEKEFNLIVLKKTKYKAKIIKINDRAAAIDCSLQPSTNSENKIIFKVIVSCGNKFNTGDILYIQQKVKNEERKTCWLILHCEDDITKGYYVYKAICLDEQVMITTEYGQTEYSFPAKFVNASNNWIQDMFAYSNHNLGYREPQWSRVLITRDWDFLKKDLYFDYKDRGWQIEEKDNISINNVAYVFISEKIQRPLEPISSQEIEVGENKNFFLNNVGDKYGL